MHRWMISVIDDEFYGELSSSYHTNVYMLPTKEHSNTQMLNQTLSALLMFRKFRIVIFHVYSYNFLIATTVTICHAVMT